MARICTDEIFGNDRFTTKHNPRQILAFAPWQDVLRLGQVVGADRTPRTAACRPRGRERRPCASRCASRRSVLACAERLDGAADVQVLSYGPRWRGIGCGGKHYVQHASTAKKPAQLAVTGKEENGGRCDRQQEKEDQGSVAG